MSDKPIEAAVEQALNRKSWQLRFDKPLEAQFEHDSHPRRRQSMIYAAWVATAFYCVFVINDYRLHTDIFAAAAWLRLGVMLPLGLCVVMALYAGVSGALREGIMAASVVMTMVISCLILSHSYGPLSYVDAFSFSLILVVGNIFFSLRFYYALAATLVSCLVMMIFIGFYEPIPIEARNLLFFMMVGEAIFTLMANFRLERSERMGYLLLLKEQLRAGDMRQMNSDLTQQSLTDPLTGVANRRKFDIVFAEYWQRALKDGYPIGVAMLDIDHFKAYNDGYGHVQGDECLRQVAQALQQLSRRWSDSVARYGGEEFVVLLGGVDHHSACEAGERLRQGVEALDIAHAGSEFGVVTVSVGVVVAMPRVMQTPEQLLSMADTALYEAKRRGRNCCQASDAISPVAPDDEVLPRI